MRGTWAIPNSAQYFQKILSVNLFGVINGINTLLPYVTKDTTPSSIIITGSKQGITNPPGNPAYNASKAAVKTLAEHLSFDLAKSHPSISTHLLVPGWTHTGMTGGNAFQETEKPKGAWTPEQVVDYLEGKMQEGKFYAICPDGDVAEEMDKKRMLWNARDLVEERQPLSRWREGYKGEFEEFMKKDL
jgi:NAD(P)-dependent dehydrogenase (short-subunit alcohol dehydrogenase family)